MFGVGVAKVHDVVSRHQHMINFPQVDYIMSQSDNNMKSPCDEHVVS